jgi:hypothetical protein
MTLDSCGDLGLNTLRESIQVVSFNHYCLNNVCVLKCSVFTGVLTQTMLFQSTM